jgi:pyridoxal phosphate enzyme (YggS family)
MHHAIRRFRQDRCEFCDTVGTPSLHPIPTDPSPIAENLAAVRAEIAAAARAASRDPTTVCLVAVSKTQSVAAVRAAIAAGQFDFGENYLQEAQTKIAAIDDPRVVWHFIGAIQSNKTRALAELFDWVHTVDRERIIRRLDEQCPPRKQLDICLQVNVDQDPNKAGVPPADARDLLEASKRYSRLRVRGLMTILDPDSDAAAGYGRLRALFDSLKPHAPSTWDTLSMGMSGDFPAAIAAGATHVRVGTAIFGRRKPREVS